MGIITAAIKAVIIAVVLVGLLSIAVIGLLIFRSRRQKKRREAALKDETDSARDAALRAAEVQRQLQAPAYYSGGSGGGQPFHGGASAPGTPQPIEMQPQQQQSSYPGTPSPVVAHPGTPTGAFPQQHGSSYPGTPVAMPREAGGYAVQSPASHVGSQSPHVQQHHHLQQQQRGYSSGPGSPVQQPQAVRFATAATGQQPQPVTLVSTDPYGQYWREARGAQAV